MSILDKPIELAKGDILEATLHGKRLYKYRHIDDEPRTLRTTEDVLTYQGTPV